jgi:hypothetical protein
MMSAQDILQDFLDRMGAAVKDNDWDLFRLGVCLPFQMVTEETTLVVESEESLREGLEAFHQMMELHHVTDYIRLVNHADLLAPQLLTGTYVTHMLRGATRIVPPFSSQMSLILKDDRWQCVSVANAMANARWPIDLPRIRGET